MSVFPSPGPGERTRTGKNCPMSYRCVPGSIPRIHVWSELLFLRDSLNVREHTNGRYQCELDQKLPQWGEPGVLGICQQHFKSAVNKPNTDPAYVHVLADILLRYSWTYVVFPSVAGHSWGTQTNQWHQHSHLSTTSWELLLWGFTLTSYS